MVLENNTASSCNEDEMKLANDAKRLKGEEVKNVLCKFEFVKVLNENSANKVVFIQAVCSEGEDKGKDAVIIFEKPHFGLDEVKSFLRVNNESEVDLVNDIYTKLCIYPIRPFNNVQVQLIFPANEKHIAKYSEQEAFFVHETPDDWQNITTKYIDEAALNIQWVFNILEHKTESERIIYEDPDTSNGFILLPDMKWDSRVINNLYALAICHRRGIRSIRDLDASHIPLLENIRDRSLQAIEDRFGIKRAQVRTYIHYQPTFYHLHVHVCHIKFQPPGIPDRNYPLNNVIENLKIDSDYYKKATLEFVLKQNEKLYDLYKHKLE